MIGLRVTWVLVFVVVAGLGTISGTAHAQAGSWRWGTPGFSQGLSPADREYYLRDQGLADPYVNYWTPFWQGGNAPNAYTGTFDQGYRNTFAVNHDINANFGIPVLGYLDIATPLLGTNELAIASTVSSVWNSIVDTVSSVWSSITSLFSNDYSSYSSYGGYADYGWDNGFDGSYGGYGDFGGGGGGSGCFVAGTPVTMADGSTRPIESVRSGDLVLSYDTRSGQPAVSQVTETFVHENWKDRVTTVLINGTLRATANHPFFVHGRWIRADQIKVGDTLVRAMPAGKDAVVAASRTIGAPPAAAAEQMPSVGTTTVRSIQRLPGADVVYNLEVAKYHDFFSGGVLVHNLLIECY